jgi:hypothetical protein
MVERMCAGDGAKGLGSGGSRPFVTADGSTLVYINMH